MLVRIFQIKATNELIEENPHLIKRLFCEIPKNEKEVDFKKNFYEEVYNSDLGLSENINEALEEMFIKFNSDHPESYKGRSLSVSDIVFIEGKGYYACQRFGWKEITPINI